MSAIVVGDGGERRARSCLGEVERDVERASRDAHAGAFPLVAAHLLDPLVVRTDERVRVPEREIDESPRTRGDDGAMELVRETDEPAVEADEPQLIVGPPRRVVEVRPGGGEEPPSGDPVVPDGVVVAEARKRVDQREAGDLVVVDGQPPRTATLPEEPRQRPVDGLPVLVVDDAVCDSGEIVANRPLHAVVDRDENLLHNRAQRREQRRDSRPRPGRHANDGERGAGAPKPRLSCGAGRSAGFDLGLQLARRA